MKPVNLYSSRNTDIRQHNIRVGKPSWHVLSRQEQYNEPIAAWNYTAIICQIFPSDWCETVPVEQPEDIRRSNTTEDKQLSETPASHFSPRSPANNSKSSPSHNNITSIGLLSRECSEKTVRDTYPACYCMVCIGG